jgi:hypothetical protein
MRLQFLPLTILLFASVAGAEEIVCEDFDGGACASGNCTFNDDHYTPTTAYAKYVTTPTPVFGSHAAHYAALEGTIEQVPFNYVLSGASRDYLRVVWYEFFQTDYPWGNNSQKIMRFHDGTPVAFATEVGLMAMNDNTQMQFYMFNISADVYLFDNTGVPIPENQWVKFEVEAQLNTPSTADGYARLWMNDTLISSFENENVRGSSTAGFTYSWVGGNYSGLESFTLPTDGSRYIDKVCFYDSASEPSTAPGGYLAGYHQ